MFSNAFSQNFVGINNPTVSTSSILLEETTQSKIYKFSFSGSPDTGGTQSSKKVNFDFRIIPSPPDETLKFQSQIEGLQTGTKFKARSVQLDGIKATSDAGSVTPITESFSFENLEAECFIRLSRVVSGGTVGGGMVCDIKGTIVADNEKPIHVEGLSGGVVEVEIFKKGFNPPEPTIIDDIKETVKEERNINILFWIILIIIVILLILLLMRLVRRKK